VVGKELRRGAALGLGFRPVDWASSLHAYGTVREARHRGDPPPGSRGAVVAAGLTGRCDWDLDGRRVSPPWTLETNGTHGRFAPLRLGGPILVRLTYNKAAIERAFWARCLGPHASSASSVCIDLQTAASSLPYGPTLVVGACPSSTAPSPRPSKEMQRLGRMQFHRANPARSAGPSRGRGRPPAAISVTEEHGCHASALLRRYPGRRRRWEPAGLAVEMPATGLLLAGRLVLPHLFSPILTRVYIIEPVT
jgi:hypothetical protein